MSVTTVLDHVAVSKNVDRYTEFIVHEGQKAVDPCDPCLPCVLDFRGVFPVVEHPNRAFSLIHINNAPGFSSKPGKQRVTGLRQREWTSWSCML